MTKENADKDGSKFLRKKNNGPIEKNERNGARSRKREGTKWRQ